MRFRTISAAFLLIAGMAMASAQTPNQIPGPASSGPSFPCTSQQGIIEATVCASPALSAADRQMAALYAANKISAFGIGPSNQLAGQRQALKDMQSCAKPSGKKTIVECLQASYNERNYELAISGVTRAPDLALPVIRHFDPTFAPVVEAVVIWASEPESTNWSDPSHVVKRTRILTLLKPILKDLLTQEDAAVARNMLDTASETGTVKQVEDLLVSPDRFASFLDVLGPQLAGEGQVGEREIPCAAIVGHPKLLKATASIYGATPDNFVFNTNCETSLPPLPAFTALDGKLKKAWPTCDGTIRFAAYRMYQTNVDAARLGFVQHDPNVGLPVDRGASVADIAAARVELAAYYARYLGKTQAQANKMAGDALGVVLDAAGACD